MLSEAAVFPVSAVLNSSRGTVVAGGEYPAVTDENSSDLPSQTCRARGYQEGYVHKVFIPGRADQFSFPDLRIMVFEGFKYKRHDRVLFRIKRKRFVQIFNLLPYGLLQFLILNIGDDAVEHIGYYPHFRFLHPFTG